MTKGTRCDKIFEPHIVGFVSCAQKFGCAPIYSETVKYQAGVENGDVIYVEKLNAEVDSEITFDKVVAVSNRTLKVGKPYVKDAFVKGTVLKNGKGKKVTVFTYKPKKSSSRKMGHRQPYTKVQITEIG